MCVFVCICVCETIFYVILCNKKQQLIFELLIEIKLNIMGIYMSVYECVINYWWLKKSMATACKKRQHKRKISNYRYCNNGNEMLYIYINMYTINKLIYICMYYSDKNIVGVKTVDFFLSVNISN